VVDTVVEIAVQAAVRQNRPVVINLGVIVMQAIVAAAVLRQEAVANVAAVAAQPIKVDRLRTRKDKFLLKEI
jgi:hypothetical protein